MVFTDNFNRSNENLEASADWTRSGGSAGDAEVNSNKVKCDTTNSTGSAYQCPDQGSADHYSEGVANAAGFGFPVCVRLTDANNFIGCRRNTISQVSMLKRVGGSFTTLATKGISSSTGNITLRIEAEGNDLRWYVGGVLETTVVDSFNNSETRQGLVARVSIRDDFLDDFEADTIAGSGGTDVLAQSLHEIEQGNPGLSRAMHTIEEGFVA